MRILENRKMAKHQTFVSSIRHTQAMKRSVEEVKSQSLYFFQEAARMVATGFTQITSRMKSTGFSNSIILLSFFCIAVTKKKEGNIKKIKKTKKSKPKQPYKDMPKKLHCVENISTWSKI